MRRWCLLLALCVATALGAAEFPPVVPGTAIVFPDDSGAHPDYRTEWWYVTGWLEDEAGHQRGFQLTFFRVRSGVGDDSPGRFSPAQLVLAHAAIADPAEGRLLHVDQAQRVSGRIAGAATGTTRVWLKDWSLEQTDGKFLARVEGEDFGYQLTLRSTTAPMLNGDRGFSQKGPEPRHASHYYSLPQLQVDGQLRLRGRSLRVTGTAWLDHEWSSELMPEGAVGWDWVGLNLDDGAALMAFRMRNGEGKTLWAGGTLRTASGETRALNPAEVEFRGGREWTSPRTGGRYPVEWRLQLADRRVEIKPLMDDQELDARGSTGAVYWEGAVRVFSGPQAIGRGYLEMTGYAGRLRM